MNQDPKAVDLTAFEVGHEAYVVDIMRVKEILRMQPLIQVRYGPRFVEGVINLHGTVVPVIDLRRRFGFSPADDRRARILVVNVEDRSVGLIVDQVLGVVRVNKSELQSVPGFTAHDTIPFCLGFCLKNNRSYILLNVKALLISDEPIDGSAMHQLIPQPS